MNDFNHGLCPICRERPANSPHHIKPVSAGGTDDPRNKVSLCKECHDLVEFLYDETGLEYSPYVIGFVRRRHKLCKSFQPPRLVVSAPPLRRRRFSFRESREPEPPPTLTTCPGCGYKHVPKRFSRPLCPVCSGEKDRIKSRERAAERAIQRKDFENMRSKLVLASRSS